jgi:ligand-binding sensor domain-containing protein
MPSSGSLAVPAKSPAIALICITILFALSGITSVQAADLPKGLSEYIHHKWQQAQGLPQDTVQAVAQTRDGYLWLGTQEGLVRFDGHTFKVFDKSNTPAFKHNDVVALAATSDGGLWIGTFSGLVHMKAGEFTAHPIGGESPRENITALAADPAGVLWIGTQNAGLHRLKDGKLESSTTAEGLSDNAVRDIAVDSSGRLWVGTLGGLDLHEGNRWRHFGVKEGLPASNVRKVLASRDGSLWVGSKDGLARLNHGPVQSILGKDGLKNADIQSLTEDRTGALWIGTEHGGVYRYAGGVLTPLRFGIDESGNTVLSIFEDFEGSIWIGTYASGIHRLGQGRFVNVTARQGLPSDLLRTVYQTRNGDIWIGTDASGVCRFDGSTFTAYSRREGLPNDGIRATLEDSRGDLWVGTRGGLARFAQGKIRSYGVAEGLDPASVRALAEDKTGTLWVGTSSGGVFRFSKGRFETVRDRDGILQAQVIRSLFCDHEGAIWIGSNNFLTRWQDGTARVFTSKDGLPPEAIYAIHEDGDHVLWFGSYGGGLVRLKNGKFSRITSADGMFDDVVYQILEDARSNLWMSCNRGIFRVSKRELNDFADGRAGHVRSVSFGMSDGMISSECNGNSQPAGWRARDGKLWFPTTKGVVVIDPENLGTDAPPPPVVIERAVVNRVPLPLDEPGVAPPGPGQAEFDFTGFSFIAPQNVRFRFMLQGQETEWVDAGSRRQTTYTNLRPGKYVFRVTACNKDRLWNTQVASYAFEIKPYFYQAGWFYGLCLLLTSGVGFAAYRLRVWQLLRHEKKLKRRVEEALAKIKVLSGLIPICAHCKKIRDDRGYWNHLERYIKEHSEATFSHGICPECLPLLYPDFNAGDEGSGDGPR